MAVWRLPPLLRPLRPTRLPTRHLERPAFRVQLSTCLLLLGSTTPALANETLQATVLHIDGDEIVIDTGRAQVSPEQMLTVYRTLEVRHPVTHKLLRDRFVIGTVRVVQPGASLSVTKVEGQPAHPLMVGDTVETSPPPIAANVATAPRANPAPEPTNTATSQSSAPPPNTASGLRAEPASNDEREMVAYFRATLAQPPERRVRIYTAYLQTHPSSPYRNFIAAETNYLRNLDEETRRAAVASAAETKTTYIEMLPRTVAESGETVELAALVHPEADFRALMLHARALEASGYRDVAMIVDEHGHARATVPAEVVRAPGFAYFVEIVDAQGRTKPAVGSAAAPKIVVVRGASVASKPRAPSTRVRFSSDLVSFDKTSGRDYFLLNEGDFLYRVRSGALYAVHMGYGNLRGEGGTVEDLDVKQLGPRPAGFSYGFFEAEFALHPLFGAAVRGTIGLGRPTDASSERSAITGGFQLRARIGSAEGTHLVLAGELMPEIGERAYLGLSWEAIERLPMSTEVVVTDQPVSSGELAVRLVYEVGYRFSDRVSVALRPSYQLRTIRHAGPGIGLAATFDW